MSFEGLSEKSRTSDRKNNESRKLEWKLTAEDFLKKFRQNNITRRNELARKSSGWNVNKENSLIQASLKLAGYDVGFSGIDGKIGTDTKKAIKKFQKAVDLKNNKILNRNGELDPDTRKALERATVEGLNVQLIEKRGKSLVDKAKSGLSESKAKKQEASKSVFQFIKNDWVSISEGFNRFFINFNKTELKENQNPKMNDIKNWNAVIPKYEYLSGKRTPEAYNKLIDQFDVENNLRYKAKGSNTYCNIFVWDVTLAMGTEIPHWVYSDGRPAKPHAEGSHELNANLVAKWLKDHGKKYGWHEKSFAEALKAANSGKPTVAVWYSNLDKEGVMDNKNPWSHDWDRPGHIAMVRPVDPSYLPVDPSNLKKVVSRSGMYISQAGANNRNYVGIEHSFVEWRIKQSEYFRFYVHK